jgi:cyclase
VHVLLQPDGSWWLSNAGIIVGRDGILLIDTCATEARTRRLQRAVDEIGAGLPVRLLAVTHEHGDHVYGASLFPHAVMVASACCRDALSGAPHPSALPNVWSPMPQWGNVAVRVPDVALSAEAELDVGGEPVELHLLGHRAHTTGDLVAWLPRRRILFVGDVVFNGVTPLAASGSVPGMLRALEWIRATFPAGVIVPGHGPLADLSALSEQTAYFEYVWELAAKGLERGIPPLELARGEDLEAVGFAGLLDSHRLVINLHRAYADLSVGGNVLTAPDIDLPAAAADAVALHGGPLPCLA